MVSQRPWRRKVAAHHTARSRGARAAFLTCKYFLAETEMVDMDRVFKALADPTRRRLLDSLRARGGQTLGELCSRLAMSRQAVTQHLAKLQRANLVATVRRGREKLHYLNPVPIHEISTRWIEKYQRKHLDVLQDLKNKLEGEPDG